MKKFTFIPVGDRVVVQPEKAEEVTASGIILAQNDVNKELPDMGIVVALGQGGTFPDCPNPSAFFEIGQKVLFNRYAGEDFSMKIDGKPEELKVLRLDAIFGIFNEK